jgi:hypothetical protein
MKITHRFAAALSAAAIAVAAFGAGAAHAGPPADVFNDNDQAWLCFGDDGAPVPPNHCLNANSRGNTGVIIVLEPDTRGPAEGISFDPKADDRPCPHDDVEGDGTWWSPGEGIWVCHHKPESPPGKP